jgi:hypothetical protein
MKFNFRKIAPVLASAVLLGSTIGCAVAATDLTAYPSTFVTKGKADVAIIVGESANAVDVIAGMDISSDLSSIYGTAGSSTSSVSGGESKKIATDSQPLYFGEYLNTTKASLTDSELPALLGKGKVEDSDSTSYDYTQKINVPITLTKYDKSVIDGYTSTTEPILYADFSDNAKTYSYELSFTPALDTSKMANKVIKIAGKEYTFSGNTAELNASDTSTGLILYGSNVDATLATKQNASYTVNGVDVSVTVVGVNPNRAATDEGAATITVNGESASIAKGKSYTIGGQRVYIRDIMVTNTQPAEGQVRVFLGSDKIAFVNGTEIKKGSTTVYGSKAVLSYSGTKVTKLAVTVTPYNLDTPVKYVTSGKDLVDPVFGFKISSGGMTPDLKDASRDKISIRASTDSAVELSFTNKRGMVYTMNLLKPALNVCLNASGAFPCDATAKFNATTLGVDTYDLVTDTTTKMQEQDYFIIGNNENSYVKRVTRIYTSPSNGGEVNVRDVSSGGVDQKFTYTGDTDTGSGTITLEDGTSVAFTVNETESTPYIKIGSGLQKYFYTKSGAKIDLTYANAPTQNASTIIISEETGYNDGIYYPASAPTTALGSTVNATFATDIARTSGYKTYLYSDKSADGSYVQVGDYTWKAISKYGTYIEKSGNENKKVDVYYPSAAAYMNVYVTAPGAVVSATGTSTAGKLGSISMTDTEAETAKPSKNLIVVGGPAANRVAATLLGVTFPFAGALTGGDAIAADEALIKLATCPYDKSKIAVAVFGMAAKDTRAATKFLIANAGSADLAKSSVILTTASGTAIVKK